MKFSLLISVQLENLTNLKPEDEDFRWYLKLKCTSCSEETTEFVYISLQESQELKGGRGSASLILKCKLCSRDNSIDIIKDSLSRYTNEDVPKFKSIVTFDCRGVEPVAFEPRVGWSAEGLESSLKFENIDLSQLDWADFDEKVNLSVSITELQFKFKRS